MPSLNKLNINYPLKVGSPVNLTVNFNETITGIVIFNINGVSYTVNVNGNNATYMYTPVSNATLNVVASFNGNSIFNGNVSNNITVNVDKLDTYVNVSDVSIIVGETAVINISVTPGATGYVNVTVNNVSQVIGLVDSKATAYVSDLINNTKILVEYLGDNKYNGYINDTAQVIVNKIADFDFNVIVSDALVGENTTVTVFVPGDASGNVTVNGKTVKVVNGTAVIVLDKEISTGDKNITVNYSNDVKYQDTGKTVNYAVFMNPSETINASVMVRGFNSGCDYQAVFYDLLGNPLVKCCYVC